MDCFTIQSSVRSRSPSILLQSASLLLLIGVPIDAIQNNIFIAYLIEEWGILEDDEDENS